MEKDVNLMLATYGKYFPETSLPQVREIFEQMDDTQAATLSCTQSSSRYCSDSLVQTVSI